MVLAGRVLCVMMASASGHVILERFYDPISEPDQMRWRDGLHRPRPVRAGASTVAGSDCDKLATRCGVARRKDENMVVRSWRPSILRSRSGEYDEYTRESSPRLHALSRCPRFRFSSIRTRPDTYPIPFPLRVVAEVLQALASSIQGIVKGFTEARAFERHGMICLALDEIVSDGVEKRPGTPSDEPSSSDGGLIHPRAREDDAPRPTFRGYLAM